MKKAKLFLNVACALITYVSYAQVPAWTWAKQAGGTNIDMANSVASDPFGNVYVAGWYNSWPINFGTDTLYTTGSYDLFLVKYNSTGNVIWSKSVGGTGNPTYELDDRAYSVTTDASGNVYLAGTFTSPYITFGGTTLTKAGTYYTDADVFLAKYDTAGTVLWAKSGAGGSGINYAWSVSTDVTGNVYLAGTFASTSITFDTTTLTNGPLFLARYNSIGHLIWAKSSNGSISGPVSVTAGVPGCVYLTGTFYGNSITFGTTTLTHTGGLGYHMFLVKFDAGGSIIWARGENGNFDDYGYSVTASSAGEVYVAGAFLSQTIVFGTFQLNNTATAPAYDSFLLRYDGNGNVIWAKGADASSGANWPGSNDRPYSVIIDAFNNVYMTGAFLCTTLTFGTTTLNNASGPNGHSDIYIARYDAGGNVTGAISAGGNSDDYAYSATVDPSGNVYAAGTFVSPVIWFGPDSLTNVSFNQDIFLAKINGNIAIGLENNEGRESIHVCPNPGKGRFTVNCSQTGEFNLEIFNITGEKVYQTSNPGMLNSNEIDLSSSPKGIYFVRIKDGKRSIASKIVIQ